MHDWVRAQLKQQSGNKWQYGVIAAGLKAATAAYPC
jgi:hypothetical protein